MFTYICIFFHLFILGFAFCRLLLQYKLCEVKDVSLFIKPRIYLEHSTRLRHILLNNVYFNYSFKMKSNKYTKKANDIGIYFKNKHVSRWPTLRVVQYQYLENSSSARVICGIPSLLCCIGGKHSFEILSVSLHFFFIILQHMDVTVSILFSFRIVELCIYEIIPHVIFSLLYYFRLGVLDSFMVMHVDVP